jgi:ketosteroid isomerase-like protein
MPRTCILVFICLLCRWPVLVQAQETADAAAVRALEMKWAESYKLRQLDVLSSLIDDDYVITFEDGSIHGKVGLLSHNAKASEHVELSDFSDLKIRMHLDTAVVTGSYRERGESGGKPYEYNDRLTDVWMKLHGKWKLIASHYSVPAQ